MPGLYFFAAENCFNMGVLLYELPLIVVVALIKVL